jgi:autotransporter translocation and assembly factor TamB
MTLSRFEQQLFASVAAALAGAKADDCLTDGLGMAHRIQDAAMNHVTEWRTRVKADRMRRRTRAKRRAR